MEEVIAMLKAVQPATPGQTSYGSGDNCSDVYKFGRYTMAQEILKLLEPQDKPNPPAERKFRAWYTHEFFNCTLEELRGYAKRVRVEFADPDNPTLTELAKVYKRTFEEMSDPWEVTANGRCRVEEVK